jgi:DNA polymerase III subunit epsilon
MLLDATRAWWSYPLVIVDFETTGVDPLLCSPVSLAAARFESGKEVASFYTLLKPDCAIPAEATAVHGITDEQCAAAPSLADVAGDLYRLAVDALPCGYNGASFDAVIFHRWIWGNDCPLFEPAQRWIDPLVMIRSIDRYVPGSGRHKLENVCKRWGVPLEGEAHNALTDVRAVGCLLSRLVELGKVKAHVTLARMLDYSDRMREQQQKDFDRYRAELKAKEAQRELTFDELDSSNVEEGTHA